MPLTLPDLPYGHDGLEPHISRRTLELHHGKHHKAYVDKTNSLIEGTSLANAKLEDIVKSAAKEGGALFNNAGQAWNHNFFWPSLAKNGGGKPTGAVATAIEQAFGGYDAFRKEFAEAAATQFGSGWAWLVLDAGKLKVTKTGNADTPLVHGQTPLVTLDVWEHAYYLDYQNRRPDFIATFLDHLLNWKFVEQNLNAAQGRSAAA